MHLKSFLTKYSVATGRTTLLSVPNGLKRFPMFFPKTKSFHYGSGAYLKHKTILLTTYSSGLRISETRGFPIMVFISFGRAKSSPTKNTRTIVAYHSNLAYNKNVRNSYFKQRGDYDVNRD